MVRAVWLLLNMTGIPRLVYRLMLDRRVPLRLKALIPAALIYLVSPIDLLPDIVPLLTHIDDALVLLIAVGLFLSRAPREVILEHIRGSRLDSASDGNTNTDQAPEPPVIEGSYHYVDEADDRRQ